MRYLFDVWDEVAHRLKSANHILLLTDYDGTLTHIVDKPELATLPQEIRKLLRKLSKNRRYTVGIISGRALTDLKSIVGLEGIIYAGNHGLEIEGFGSSFLEPIAEEMRPFFNMLNQALSATLRGIKGAFVEDKGLTVSVHYRLVDDAEEGMVKDTFRKITDPLHVTGKIRITQGKKVYEIRPPVNWDKGKAIAWFIAKNKEVRGRGKALPIYLGDDLTDEDGFKVIGKNDGISIFVGDGSLQSAAHYFLKSPEDVAQFLKMI
jgi:trehalose 6-phosphate phosphatase